MKIKFWTVLAMLTFCMNSCMQKEITTPEELGRQVFYMLTNISDDTKEDFSKSYVSLEELHILAKSDSVPLHPWIISVKFFPSITDEQWLSEIDEDYNEIKKVGIKNNFEWNNIKYVDFIYEKANRQNFNCYSGTLYFKYKNQTYSVHCECYVIDGKFKISKIRKPVEYRK